MNNTNITTEEKIRILAARRKMKMGDIAEETGQTRQNLSNKMKRGDFKESELRSFAQLLNCTLEVSFIDNETGEKI